MKKIQIFACAVISLYAASASAQLTASVKQQSQRIVLQINTMDKKPGPPDLATVPVFRMQGPKFNYADLEVTESGASRVAPVKNMEVIAFPNPFAGELTLAVNDACFASSHYEAQVYTMQGKKVYSQRLYTAKSGLSLASLCEGMYILQVHKNGDLVLQEKVIKE